MPMTLAFFCFSFWACQSVPPDEPVSSTETSPLFEYVQNVDSAFSYEVQDTLLGEGHTTYLIRMVSQRWLTEAEVKDPLWWHWLTVVVPDGVENPTGLLFIGGGSRNREQPTEADQMLVQTALATQTVVADLHNVPNQPVEFVSDTFGPRVEDELIAYGWRKFMENGAKREDAEWLARLPMTTAAVRALDVLQELDEAALTPSLERFVVAGGSKRGWTTWTTGIVDDRVVGIVPIVIDLLNVVPSFEHHWQAYGEWAPAVGNYVYEGIMEWQDSQEYQQLLAYTEPFSYRDQLDMPKLLINATGDQFFLPDSWQFYWDSLPGEKHLRYVANGEHSLRGTDAIESLIAFHGHIAHNQPRPKFDWRVEGGKIIIDTDPNFPPEAIQLWQASNPEGRDFRVDVIDRSWTAQPVLTQEGGHYELSIPEPEAGYAAFFVELTFPTQLPVPLKMSTGVVVTPDTYPHEPYQAENPKGTPVK
ncbi:MAG: PhoPQ-activated pathogenicity-related family protein [Bacteroidota bacterium]